MNNTTNSSYYVIYFSNGGKMRVAGRLFHNYMQAIDYAKTIAGNRKPTVVKAVTKGELKQHILIYISLTSYRIVAR